MPQIQPNQVVPGQNGVPKLYGVGQSENSVPFQERLMRLFKPQEFVAIKNIDDEPLYWQYQPIDSETESFSEDGMQKQIYRGAPEMWVIEAGATDVLVGASAYRALDVLYKNVTAKMTLKRYNDPSSPRFDEKGQHLPKNFNFADGGAQDAFIEQAYLGKAMPTFAGQEAATAPPAATTQGANTFAPAVAAEPTPIDPAATRPKMTDGAPLAPVSYAEPDKPDETTAPTTGVTSHAAAK